MTTPVGSDAEAPGIGSQVEDLSVSVRRVVPAPVGTVWQLLVSREGTEAWLGEGAQLGGKGEPYHCTDGTGGVVRSYHPLEQLRVSWHATPDAPPSLVEVDLTQNGDGTEVLLRHDHLHGAAERDALEQRWTAALETIAERAVT